MPPMRATGYISALPAILQQQQDDYIYRVYVTEMLQLSVQGKYIQTPWRELVRRYEQPEDNRSVEEQAEEFAMRAGLVKMKEKEKTSSEQTTAEQPRKRGGKQKKVLCIDTGEIFDSLTKAAERHGVSVFAISNAVRGKSKTAAKLRWQYA